MNGQEKWRRITAKNRGPDHGPVEGYDVARVIGRLWQGRVVVCEPVGAVGLGVCDHGEGAAENVGHEDDEEERVEDADERRQHLRTARCC